MNTRGRDTIILLGIADALIAVIGVSVWSFLFCSKPDVILALTAILLGLVTFFGFMTLGHSLGAGWALNKGGMRTAITAAVVIVYFFVLALAIFIQSPDKIKPITESMLTSFTTITAVVIAFYFGSTAYVQTSEGGEVSEQTKPAAQNDR